MHIYIYIYILEGKEASRGKGPHSTRAAVPSCQGYLLLGLGPLCLLGIL